MTIRDLINKLISCNPEADISWLDSDGNEIEKAVLGIDDNDNCVYIWIENEENK